MWTDRLGFIAANETLKKLKKEKVNLKINKIGKKIKKAWIKIAKKNNINIKVSGLNAIPSFSFEYKNNKEISTFFIQEMLKKGFLANNTISISYAYTDQIIKKYLSAFDKVFKQIKFSLNKKKFLLDGPIRHSTFRRLTG